MKGRPASERALEMYSPEPMSGCWIWTGYVDPYGYGRIAQGKIGFFLAHRLMYQTLVGPIGKGLEIDHKCRLRCCVNPDHLEAVTGRINTLRGIGITALNAKKTECSRGHKFNSANTYISPNGNRVCKICRSAWVKKYRNKRMVSGWEAGREAAASAVEKNTCVLYCEKCETVPCGKIDSEQIRSLAAPSAAQPEKGDK